VPTSHNIIIYIYALAAGGAASIDLGAKIAVGVSVLHGYSQSKSTG
jgi:hypothetical protein